jgi:hypothetical protein
VGGGEPLTQVIGLRLYSDKSIDRLSCNVAVSIVKLKRAADYELQTARPRLCFLQPTQVQQDPALHGGTSFCPSGLSIQAYKATLKIAVRILSWNREAEYAVHPAGLFASCLYHLTVHVKGTQINYPNST